MNPNAPTVNGDYQDVAAFFGVSKRQVENWVSDGEISHGKDGRNIVFYLEDVVERKARTYRDVQGLPANAATERAKREWLEHLRVRADYADLLSRVATLEQKLNLAAA